MLVERAGWPKGKATDNFLKTPFGVSGRRPSGVECVLFFLYHYHFRDDFSGSMDGVFFANLSPVVLSRNCTTLLTTYCVIPTHFVLMACP